MKFRKTLIYMHDSWFGHRHYQQSCDRNLETECYCYIYCNIKIFASLNILDEVTLLFVGDISFAGPIKYYVDHKYHTYNDTFNDVAPFIREADISVGNLESPFANQHVLTHILRGSKSILLYAIPKAASALRWKS